MKRSKLAGAVHTALILAALNNGVSVADELSVGPSDLDTVVVTGSRVARDAGFESPVPMVTLDSRAIHDSGFSIVGDVLFNLPQASVSSGLQGTGTVFNSGQSRVDLRGLDSGRTLVLLDGRRFVTGDFRVPAVDLNLLPSSMIERIDVISGGASAVYGSEAIAGVVNIVTRKHFDGFTFDVQGGESQERDGGEIKLAVGYGDRFAGNRGSYLVGVEYTDVAGIWQVDRDWAYPGIRRNTGVTPQTIIPASRSNIMPTATFQLQAANSVSIALDRSTLHTNSAACRTASVSVLCQDPWLFYIPSYNLLQSPMQRVSVRGFADFALNDNLTLFADAMYAAVEARGVQSPAFSNASGSGGIPVQMRGDNAYLNAAATPLAAQLRDAWLAAGRTLVRGTAVNVGKFWEEFGTRDTDILREVYRGQAGLNGRFQMWNRDFTWETYAQYSETRGRVLARNQPHRQRVQQAVDAVVLGGEIVCESAAARAEGCVPWNLIDGPSPEAVAWANATARYNGLAAQTVAAAHLSGSLFDLPGGAFGVASGIEYRREFSDFIPDEWAGAGVLFFTPVPRTRGAYEVKEIYVEAVAPLLADLPAVHRLSIEAAGRLADYSTAGTVDQWRLQSTWAPVQDVTFRASLATAVRAPNITEAYGPRSPGNTSAALDPCDRAQIIAIASQPERQATRIANCSAAIPGYDPATFQSNAGVGSIPTITGSNDKLFEERAKTLSAGVVFEPRWLDRLRLSVDYWRIELEDAITTIPVNTLLSTLCYDVAQPVNENRFCQLIRRELTAGQPSTGHILQIQLTNQNAEAINTSGVDVAVAYAQSLGAAGELDLRVDATKTIRWDLIGFPGSAPSKLAGTLTSAIPDYKAQAALGWRFGRFYGQWRTRFQDSYAVSSVDPPSSRDPFYTGNYFEHDLAVQFQLSEAFGVRAGVINVTDETPPLVPEVGNGIDSNTSASYDNRGRWFYFGFKHSFGE